MWISISSLQYDTKIKYLGPWISLFVSIRKIVSISSFIIQIRTKWCCNRRFYGEIINSNWNARENWMLWFIMKTTVFWFLHWEIFHNSCLNKTDLDSCLWRLNVKRNNLQRRTCPTKIVDIQLFSVPDFSHFCSQLGIKIPTSCATSWTPENLFSFQIDTMVVQKRGNSKNPSIKWSWSLNYSQQNPAASLCNPI